MFDPFFFSIASGLVSLAAVAWAIYSSRCRHQQLHETQSSESRLRAIMNTAIDGIVMIDGDGIVQNYNSAAEHILGWSAAEVIGQNVNMLMPEPHHSAHDNYLLHHLQTGQERIIGQGREAEARHKDGHLVPIRLTVGRVPLPGKPLFIGFLSDISQRRAIEQSLCDRDEQFRALSENFEGIVHALNRAQAVIEFDLQGHVLTANDNFLRMMGYRLDEIQGRHHRLFCTPEYAASPEYAALWERVGRGGIDAGEYLRIGKNGRQVWIQATYNPVFDGKCKPVKIIKFATDLSERHAMEQALRQAKESAEQAAAARGMFLANMSHEIRTPMNAIIGFTEALLDSSLDAVQRRHLGTVHHTARSMLRLLNDILDTAKLEKGAVELEVNDFSLRATCEQVLASLRITAHKKGLELLMHYDSEVPDYLRGDALRIQQILVNLVGNAIKFTEVGHVSLNVTYTAGHVCLEVQDTGIGIAPEHLQHIFNPFSQADASTSRRFGGTGLGTTISRQLTELMGGCIHVRSALGRGSTFSVTLPLPLGQPVIDDADHVSYVLRPLRILAVDDVPNNLELLELTLARGNHQVTLAHSGAAAVALCREQTFDLVLMDLQMPDVDGLEATRQVRAYEQAQGRKPTPIIALSASVMEQDRRNALAAGMDGFASKPLEPQRLQTEMARVLDIRLPKQPPRPQRSQLRPAPASEDTPPIDWERGIGLWTQADLLHTAIERFLVDSRHSPATLQTLYDQGDWSALAAAAHRLRGAAGNLALGPLHAVVSRIETAARAADAAAVAPLLTMLPDAIAAVEQAVQDSHAHGLTPTSAPCSALNAEQRAQIETAFTQLERALSRCELPEAALSTLSQLLPALAREPLQHAIDQFDFEQAQESLQRLRVQWLPATDEAIP